MVRGADDALLLHPLDEACGVVVANAELALDVARRSLLALRDGLDGLAVELAVGIVLAGRLTLEHVAAVLGLFGNRLVVIRSEEHTSELQSLMRISYAVFCLKKKKLYLPVIN